MVTPGLKTHFEQMGVALIPLDDGAGRMVSELLGGGDDVQVVIGGSGGDGALGVAATPAATVDVHVSDRSHPYLADHRIGGMAVVPVALALEWMLRAARACRPDLVPVSVRAVKVLRGIRLDHFEGSGDRFVVRARQVSNGSGAEVAVELRGPNDALHYSSTIELATKGATPRAVVSPGTLEHWTAPSIYDGHVLFHGARFQVIRSIDGVSREGIAGTLAGATEAGWPAEAWQTDPAVLDGGLQLVLLWARHVLGGAALPMAVGEYRPYRAGLVSGPVRCVLRSKSIHDARVVADVAFVDASGTAFAEMLGVEAVQRPGEPASASPSVPALA